MGSETLKVEEGVIVGGAKTGCDVWKPCKAVAKAGEKAYDFVAEKGGAAYDDSENGGN